MAFMLMTFTGCKSYEQIKIVSGKMESLNMNGLRAADLVFTVEVENPAGKVIIEDVVGTLKHSGKVLGNVTLAPLTLEARTTAEYKVNALVELDKSVSFMNLMNFMDVKKLNECTIDLSAKGKAAGIKIKKEYKDIPVKKLLEGQHYEKI